MRHSDFAIGCEFTTANGTLRWRCTDIGTRTITAIHIDPEKVADWYNGPPYAVTEHVFDENDIPGAELTK